MMSASSSNSAPKEVFRIESIELNTIQQDDKIIVLLGPTGVGKSNFIENLSETKLNISSPRLQRGTNDLTLYRIIDHPIWKSNILLADTPGFLDVTLSEYSAVKTIRQWIKSSKAPQLHALFYVDRITNPPKGGDKHCWELFTSLCGESEASRACLMTTAWDDVGKRQAAVEKKRKHLQAYWEAYMSKGMQYFEFQNTAASANKILTAALEIATTLPKRFVLENMKASLKKAPVLTPIFHLLSDRYRSVILLISNVEEDIQGPFTEEVLRAERSKLQVLRNDLGGLRSEMLEFSQGRWLVAKIYLLNLPSTFRSAVQTTVDRFTTRQPSPQIPVNIPIPDHGHTKVDIPDKPPTPIIATPDTQDQQPTCNSLADVVKWYIARREETMEANRDIVLLVMGPAGSGKTSFIRSCYHEAMDNESLTHLPINHNSDSETGIEDIKLHIIKFPEAGARLILVDTPGFEDSRRTNVQSLTNIATYLENSYRKGQLLDGVIYLHRITDAISDSGTMIVLNIFRKLIGNGGYDKLAVVTTMWDNITPGIKSTYEEKEQELKDWQWGALIDRDNAALVVRYDASDNIARRSAQSVVSGLLCNSNRRDGLITRLQEQLVDEKLSLQRTDAGQIVMSPSVRSFRRFLPEWAVTVPVKSQESL